MIRLFSIVGVLTFALVVQSAAQDRKKDEEACGRDATRLCKRVLEGGDYAILECLKTNRPRLRPVCLKHLREVGQLN
jgi:hypothetical protein